MKFTSNKDKPFVALLLGIILALLACSQKQALTPEMLGQKVVAALKENNAKAFAGYYITPTQLKNKLHKLGITQEQDYINYYASNHALIETVYFNYLIKEGRQKGIVWKDITYSKVDYKVITTKGYSKADIYVYFTQGGNTHILKLDDCTQAEGRGWCLLDDVSLQ